MQQFRSVDLGILVGYLVCVVGLGAWLSRKSRTTEQYTLAGRSLPFWAVGLSIFGSYISSISFLANPGKSFAGNWNPFVFSLATPVAALVAVRVFVPFYRRSGHVSAYEHLESRFGGWARTYAVFCYLLTQMARTGTIIYLLALATAPLLAGSLRSYGWGHAEVITLIIVLTGSLMTVYTMLGGMEAVIWVGTVNSIVLLAGPIVCVAALLLAMPGGAAQIVEIASEHDKFSLGSFGSSLSEPTFWVVLLYGVFINLGNFSIDQGYVQRYLTAKSDRAAAQSVWLGALLYVPVAAVFFFLGTGLFALYSVRPELLGASVDAANRPDAVFPFFIVHQLPVGLSGLVIAAIFAAAMDPSLNSMATLTLCDIYQRHLRPRASDRESLWVLRLSTLAWGALCTIVALAMIEVKNVLDVWWELAGIFSSGMLGVFLLGLISKRAGNREAILGVVAGVLMTLWLSLSTTSIWPAAWVAWANPLHSFLTIVVGTSTIVIVGMLAGVLGMGGPVKPNRDES